MKLLPGLLAVCLLLTGCGGLPYPREMGDMALLRTMGVDREARGLTVTVSTGLRARGLQGETEEPLVLSAARPSLDGACLAMQGQSDSYVYFGYVDQLLLGEELARLGVQPVLDYFARDGELGLGAQLWLVRGGTAREAVNSGGGEGVDKRLQTLQTDSRMGIASITRTAGEIYTDLLEQGAAFAPALVLSGGEESVLTEGGYGIFKDGALMGFLEGEAAKGLELLYGGLSEDVLEVELPGNKTALRIGSARTSSRLVFQGDVPTVLHITCEVKASLSEYQVRPGASETEKLKEALRAREVTRLERALERLQSWGADCAGLGARAAMACPARWQAVEGVWAEWFARVPIDVTVKVRLL